MAPDEESNIEVVVTVAPEEAASVAGLLQDAGMEVAQMLPSAGVVTGAAPAGDLEVLREVDGVLAVEPARDVELPPPGAPQ